MSVNFDTPPVKNAGKTQAVNDAWPQPERDHDVMSARLHQAADAVRGLAGMGLTALSVRVEGRRAVIWLRQAPRGSPLRGAATVMRGTAQGREYVMAAPFGGCQVQWTERGS